MKTPRKDTRGPRYRPNRVRRQEPRTNCRGGIPGEKAKRIVELLRSGITCEVELARLSGSPRSYVTTVLDMPARVFPK